MTLNFFKQHKAVKAALIFLLVLSTTCGLLFGYSKLKSPESVDKSFEHFTNELFCQEVSSNSITLHYTLKDPSAFGIKDAPVTLGSCSTDSAAICSTIENTLAVLQSFERKSLSEKNRLTYDVLDSYLTSSLNNAKYALYEEPLAPLTGTQSQLPVLLSEFQFYDVSDVDTYLDLLTKAPEYFQSISAFEQAKSKAGLFMASYTADSIIEECKAFINMGPDNYLYSSFEERLRQLNLSQEETAAYIEQNKNGIEQYIFPAYQALADTLTTLRTSGKNNNGLCYYPDGKKYYESVVESATGSSRSIPELQELTKSQMRDDLTAMQEVLSTLLPQENDAANNADTDADSDTADSHKTQETAAEVLAASAPVLEDASPASILENLKSKLDGSFPALPEVNTEVKYVQKSMEEYLSPAFYMVPAIDSTKDNVIYINKGHLPDDLSLFTTLAHEGFPGHLYQTVYYSSTDPDPIRNLLGFGGYTEGWATYSEMLSYYYAPISKDQATLMQHNTSVILGLYALADMGIHYDGWTLIDTVSFFRGYGITDTETIEDIYDLIIADPANYLKYYIGYVEFVELKKEAIEKWGDKFTQERFHKAVLDAGPASFDVIRDYIF